jgi:CHAD domain-containing protein
MTSKSMGEEVFMPLEVDRFQKPVRKLRKFLKKMSPRPTPGKVHDFRTNTRRVEASVAALSLDSKRNGRRLLKELARVRKKAGKVRDMDVLTGFASSLHPKDENDCAVQLLEHLGARRENYAKRMYSVVHKRGALLRRRLKRISTRFDKLTRKNGPHAWKAAADVTASAISLSAELSTPRRLGRTSLHPYRLKVKQLRNLLQMAKGANDQSFVDTLGEVKDAIGEWHDWEELVCIAADVLNHGPKCQLLAVLKKTSNDKYEHASRLTEQMRMKYLRSSKRPSRPAHGRTNGLAEPLLTATAALGREMGYL